MEREKRERTTATDFVAFRPAFVGGFVGIFPMASSVCKLMDSGHLSWAILWTFSWATSWTFCLQDLLCHASMPGNDRIQPREVVEDIFPAWKVPGTRNSKEFPGFAPCS